MVSGPPSFQPLRAVSTHTRPVEANDNLFLEMISCDGGPGELLCVGSFVVY